MMKEIIKISLPIVLIIGFFWLVVTSLDLGSLEGHGKVQKARFNALEKRIDSLEMVSKYKLFRPYSTDGINASGDIQGFLWSKKNNIFHGHLATLANPPESDPFCIDWTVNGLGMICEKDGLRVHPCNSGRRVLDRFSFYKYDVENILMFEDKVVSELSKIRDEGEVIFGDVSCQTMIKFEADELPISAVCRSNEFAVCKSSE